MQRERKGRGRREGRGDTERKTKESRNQKKKGEQESARERVPSGVRGGAAARKQEGRGANKPAKNDLCGRFSAALRDPDHRRVLGKRGMVFSEGKHTHTRTTHD